MNGLRAFEAAGRHLNFRLAAEELGVTQSAIAQQVRGLEERLGISLFERRHRSLAFTEAGRAYHGEVARAFAILEDATARLRPAAQTVTISVPPSFATKWLMPHLPEFRAVHPEIDLRILATDRVMSFHADGIDLAVRQAKPPFGASLAAERLFENEIVAVCAPSLLPGDAAVHPPEMLASVVLLHDPHNLWPAFLKKVAGLDRVDRIKGMHFNLTTLCIDAALAGQGVALASRFLVATDLAAGRLVQPVAGTLDGGQDFYLLGLRSRKWTAAVDAVWRWLLDWRDRAD